ncbi:hypothetical protein KBG23_00430 [Candidatus Dojkabacteria bacterium]|jgi:hypothetical protein|nr:hypothetical protein [Candidatus Dojkabacteria bacterium]
MEKKDNKYNALGFVEALISIVIVGISSVVLMRIAASALIEAVQNDKIDRTTQFAVEGGNIVKELYEKGGDGFPDLQYLNDISQCYIIIGGYIQPNKPQTFSFSSPGWGTFNHCVDPFVNGSTDNRKECKKGYHAWNTNKQYPFFRLACMKVEGTKEKYISVKIVVGELNYDGRVTRSGNVKDYAYQTIIPLED